MTKPRLYEEVALTRDLPEENLKEGDVAVVVDYLPHPTGEKKAQSWKFSMQFGESMAVVVVPISAIESLRADQVSDGTRNGLGTRIKLSP